MYGIMGSPSTFYNPLLRGMFSYALIWPACSIAQDYIENGVSLYRADWARASRFGVFGSLCMAPVWHHWMKYTNKFFMGKSLSVAIKRSVFEQLTYSPLATVFFYFGMSVLERKSMEECIQEVQDKFWPTYKIGFFYWPLAQTINFSLVAKKNRLVFLSAASFVWMMFMAHMKQDTNTSSAENTKFDKSKDFEEPPKTPQRFLPVVNANLHKDRGQGRTAITYLGVGFEDSAILPPDNIQKVPESILQGDEIKESLISENDAIVENVSEVVALSNKENMNNEDLEVNNDIASSIRPCFTVETVEQTPVTKNEEILVPTKEYEQDSLVDQGQHIEIKKLTDSNYTKINDIIEKTDNDQQQQQPSDKITVVKEIVSKPVYTENEDVMAVINRDLDMEVKELSQNLNDELKYPEPFDFRL